MSSITDHPAALVSVPVDALAEIISDAEIIRVHGHANFGPTMSPRDVVNEGVLKYAIGYHSGHTQLTILLEHGLITKPRPGSYDASLTKKGKKYARALHSAGKTLRNFATAAPQAAEAGRRAKSAAELQDELGRLADQFTDLYGAAEAVKLAAWTDRHGRLHGHEAVAALDRVLTGLSAQPQAREDAQ